MVDCLPPTTSATCFCFLVLLLFLFCCRPYNSRSETTLPQSSCIEVASFLVLCSLFSFFFLNFLPRWPVCAFIRGFVCSWTAQLLSKAASNRWQFKRANDPPHHNPQRTSRLFYTTDHSNHSGIKCFQILNVIINKTNYIFYVLLLLKTLSAKLPF